MASMHFMFVICILLHINQGESNSFQETGPLFLQSPPYKVEIVRSHGAVVDCLGVSYPDPQVSWIREDGIQVESINGVQLLANGSLFFQPTLMSDNFSKLHSSTYRCKISNRYGTIISPPVHVSFVSEHMVLSPRVYDEYVILGCTAVIKCQLPGYAKENIEVVSWYIDEQETDLSSNPTKFDKYSMVSGGNLHIKSIKKVDEQHVYKCKVKHKITGQLKLSDQGGRVHVTMAQNALQPVIHDFQSEVNVKAGDSILIPCAAQGYPPPIYNWTKVMKGTRLKIEHKVLEAGALFIETTSRADDGIYECRSINNIGSSVRKLKLTVIVDLQVYIQPERYTLDVGSPLRINCSFSGNPIEVINWYRNGKSLNITGPELEILETDEKSIGSYQCFVENDFQIEQATTSVLVGNIRPLIIKKFSSYVKSPGDSIKLSCKARGSPRPSITWYRDGQEINRNENTDISSYFNAVDEIESTINVMDAKVKDGGEYRCHASNRIGHSSFSENINIYGRPFVRLMQNLTVADGEDVTLRCFAAGYPIKRIFWTKGRRRLSNRRVISYDNGTLVIKKLRLSKDKGKYTCTAIGADGIKDHRDVWINVMIAPVLSKKFSNEKLSLGDAMNLNCNVLRGTQPVNIIWLKNSKPISYENGVLASKTSVSSLLQVKSVLKSHEGNYTCISSNSAGKDIWSIIVVINIPPTILSQQFEYWGSKGYDVIIDCKVEGSPKPNLEWYRDEELLYESHKYDIKKNGSLIIKKLTELDEGIYSCSADNGLSTPAFADFNLFIGKLPSLNCNKELRNYEKRKLVCKLEGNLPMTIKWFRNGNCINNYSLTFKDMVSREMVTSLDIENDEEFEEAYSVVVYNKYGRSEYTFQLNDGKNKFNDKLSPTKQAILYDNGDKDNMRMSNIDLELDEAPIIDYLPTNHPNDQKVMSSKDKNSQSKVTFMQILVASVTTAIIILLFVLLLVLIVLWKRRSDKRDDQEVKYYENQEHMRNDEYHMNTMSTRYGKLEPGTARSFDTLPGSNYYSSISPYATFNPDEANCHNETTNTLRSGLKSSEYSNANI